MKLVKSLLLPILTTSFCFGLVGCTNDTSSSTPVVGSTSIIRLSQAIVNDYFSVEIKKSTDADIQPNEYVFNVRMWITRSERVSVYSETNISIEVKCTYKLSLNTNTAHSKKQTVSFTFKPTQKLITSDYYTLTFDQPIEEYPYFGESYSVTSASGKLKITYN